MSTHTSNISLPLTILSMIPLKLKFFASENSIHAIINLLQNIHNLHQLTVETVDIDVDEHQWKLIIYPNLNYFD